MSPVIKTTILSTFAIVMAVSACSTPNSQSGFDPDKGRHIGNWAGTHWSAYLTSMNQCAECHGVNFDGGISKMSCFSTSMNGITCHGGAGWRHLTGWESPGLHGAFAKTVPTLFSGFAHCETCHTNFGSGSTGFPCLNAVCHVNSDRPHPTTWVGGPYTHTTTNEGNAPACADCHRQNPGIPGCFNNTLCHGSQQ